MKKLLFLIYMLVSMVSSANVSKVYIAHSSEALGTVPVHGTSSWSAYIGLGKLAFAKGNSYKLKIEYSGVIPPGTIKVSNSSALISNVVQAGNVFTFTLSVPAATARLSIFQIGYFKSGTALNYPINCEVIETGKLFSMVVKDTTNTFMVTFAPKSDKLLQMTFIKGTGNKEFMFYGSQLEHIKFNAGLPNVHSSGFTYGSSAFQSGGPTTFTLKAAVAIVPVSGSKLTDHMLSLLIDNAADKHFPWATYQYAQKMEGVLIAPSPMGNSGGGIISAGTLQFEVLPGTIIPLVNGYSGFYNFLSSGFNIN